jgi:hypothetical protein
MLSVIFGGVATELRCGERLAALEFAEGNRFVRDGGEKKLEFTGASVVTGAPVVFE